MKTNQLWVIFWQVITYTILVMNLIGNTRIHIAFALLTLFAGAVAGFQREEDDR